MSLRSGVISVIALAAALTAGEHGIRPRPTPDDYPARQTVQGYTIAAAVLTPEQVKKRFAADLNKGYIVVEVAFYPANGGDIKLATRDFVARFGSESEIERPVSPEAIAARLGKKDSTPTSTSDTSKVHIYTVETIGYEHGPVGPNGRSQGGVYTGTTTGVSVGGPPYPPPAAPQSTSGLDRTSIQLELDDFSLPDRTITEETAGYLYFNKPAKSKSSPLHLTYYSEQGKIELTVPMK